MPSIQKNRPRCIEKCINGIIGRNFLVLPFVEEWFVCYFVRNGNKDAAKIRDGIEGAVERECDMRKNRLLMKVS